MAPLAIACGVVAVAVTVALRLSWADSLTMWLIMGVPYAVLAGLAVRHFWEEGTLADVFRFRAGDFTIGAVVALVLMAASWLLEPWLVPAGSPQQLWLIRLQEHIGAPRQILYTPRIAGVVLLPLMQELVWRGWVLDVTSARLGERRGWLITALAYGAAHLPTLLVLRDPVSGSNPLVVILAFGAGLVLTFLAARVRRLPPVMIAHVLFAILAATRFRLPT